MKFYKYWAKATQETLSSGQPWKVERFGASNQSLSDAQQQAEELTRQTADRLRTDGAILDRYPYADRPVREEVIEEFGDDANPYAVITRNAYGSLVLNTARVLFADIDTPEKKFQPNPLKPLLGMLGKFLGATKTALDLLGDLGDDEADDIPELVADFVSHSPGLGLRLYRTAAGFRCLVTSREYEPLTEESNRLLAALESDPLYVQLCRVQECFRARLTPKFWRCGEVAPPVRFPWANASQEQSMRAWEQAYNRSIESYATCEFVESFGTPGIAPQIASIVELHDQLSCQAGMPLA